MRCALVSRPTSTAWSSSRTRTARNTTLPIAWRRR